MIRTIAEAIRHGAGRLRAISENPRLESRLLLAHALGLSPEDLIRDSKAPVDTTGFDAVLKRREAHEPIALILGHWEFWSMDLLVSSATLIPRADSETLIRAAIGSVPRSPDRILDLGTGTGCLLLALLTEFPAAFGIGVDISLPAVQLAQTNAARTGLSQRAGFVQASWTNPIKGRFDVIISNPPYIVASDIPTLMPEVACYEPLTALDGGRDGYDAYRTLIPRLADLLSPGGIAVFELGFGQADTVESIAGTAGFSPSLHMDLAGIARAIVLKRIAG